MTSLELLPDNADGYKLIRSRQTEEECRRVGRQKQRGERIFASAHFSTRPNVSLANFSQSYVLVVGRVSRSPHFPTATRDIRRLVLRSFVR